MYYQIGSGCLYRVTRPNTVWPEPVQGLGAFYLPRTGNRYNAPHQVTVSCSEDPLVAITEAAYYQALNWREAIASSLINAVIYPLRSEHLFWAFQINPLPSIVNLEDPIAITTFGFSPLILTNPGQNFRATQEIANSVRGYKPALGSVAPHPEGVIAPSVRTPGVRGYQPKQLALFVVPREDVVSYDQRSNLVVKLRLEIEFFAASPRREAVTYGSVAIHWTKPRYRLSGISGQPSSEVIPALAGRPGARPIPLNRWLDLSVCY